MNDFVKGIKCYCAILYVLLSSLLSLASEKKFIDPRTGIEIVWEIDTLAFHSKSCFTTVTVPDGNIDYGVKIVLHALNKYPEEILRKNLKKVFIMDSLKCNGFDWGGTYVATRKSIYIVIDKDEVYTEQGVHHEFSSLLMKQYYEWFNEKKWKRTRPMGFKYIGDGQQALEMGKTSKSNEVLYKKGYVYEYATASVEEDFNCISEKLFKSDPNFWNMVKKYRRLRKKVRIAAKFYANIHNQLNLSYFKSISLK